MIFEQGSAVKKVLPFRFSRHHMGSMHVLCYNDPMSETQHPQAHESLSHEHVERIYAFMRAHRTALEPLIGGKLLDDTGDKSVPAGRGWRNVVEHCIDVGRAIDLVAELLGLPDEEREAIVNVGLVHDWNKRLTKDGGTFNNDEREFAETYAKRFLNEHDPKGHLLNATEPAGLQRLEGTDATIGEHLVHLIDLSSMAHGIATPEDRIADLRERHKGAEGETDEFWERKLALALEEERKILGLLRENGASIPDGARLRDVIRARL